MYFTLRLVQLAWRTFATTLICIFTILQISAKRAELKQHTNAFWLRGCPGPSRESLPACGGLGRPWDHLKHPCNQPPALTSHTTPLKTCSDEPGQISSMHLWSKTINNVLWPSYKLERAETQWHCCPLCKWVLVSCQVLCSLHTCCSSFVFHCINLRPAVFNPDNASVKIT